MTEFEGAVSFEKSFMDSPHHVAYTPTWKLVSE